MLPKDTPYLAYVRKLRARYPCLQNLLHFMTDFGTTELQCRLSLLEFHENTPPTNRVVQPEDVKAEISNAIKVSGPENLALNQEDSALEGCPGRILVVEDLTRQLIEDLGVCLDIDPLFFASYIDTDQMGTNFNPPRLASLPSRMRRRNHATFNYHRTIHFPDYGSPEPTEGTETLLREGNVRRKVVVVPFRRPGSRAIGLAAHCCSVFMTHFDSGTWFGLVLVDRCMSDTRLWIPSGFQPRKLAPDAACSLFLDGFEDFVDPPLFSQYQEDKHGPSRKSLYDDLLYYWVHETPPFLRDSNANLFEVAAFPLRIILGEWQSYFVVLYLSITQYEHASDLVSDMFGFLAALRRLSIDMSEIYRWRRRCMASQEKVSGLSEFLEEHALQLSHEESQKLAASMIQDFRLIAHKIEDYKHHFETLLPVVTWLVNIVDSRRAYLETTDISRLTALAVIFGPLTFVSSLFSMDSEVVPGGPKFWLYLVLALPLTIVVYCIAKPPFKELRKSWKQCAKSRSEIVRSYRKADNGLGV